jgi:hypothetical protein
VRRKKVLLKVVEKEAKKVKGDLGIETVQAQYWQTGQESTLSQANADR